MTDEKDKRIAELESRLAEHVPQPCRMRKDNTCPLGECEQCVPRLQHRLAVAQQELTMARDQLAEREYCTEGRHNMVGYEDGVKRCTRCPATDPEQEPLSFCVWTPYDNVAEMDHGYNTVCGVSFGKWSIGEGAKGPNFSHCPNCGKPISGKFRKAKPHKIGYKKPAEDKAVALLRDQLVDNQKEYQSRRDDLLAENKRLKENWKKFANAVGVDPAFAHKVIEKAKKLKELNNDN